MHLGRKQDLSIIYWLKGLYESRGITVLDGFPESEFVVPSISVEWKDIDTYQLQLGSYDRNLIRSWYIEVFAVSKTQKDEIVFNLLDETETTIDVYDYDQGYPPVSVPKIGVLDIIALKANNIQVFPELTEKMYYRATVNFVTQYETIGGI